jgi:hypothetical protein
MSGSYYIESDKNRAVAPASIVIVQNFGGRLRQRMWPSAK